ncbi:conserved hypothetical protein [Streptomyces filamentosus NRRL 15998]|uniref:Uncharacterized protein n=1 Tax=Streptomyces filamentosus NRRL 15998 TaxID=457431 RepID=D6ALY3_STRFL|nr:conserved hypothetical protein [Streptomyces filamentosus NRRL 15998]
MQRAARPEQPLGHRVPALRRHPEPRLRRRQTLALLDQAAQLPHRLHVTGLHRLPQQPLGRVGTPLGPGGQGERPQPPYRPGVPGGGRDRQRARIGGAAVPAPQDQQDPEHPHDPAQADQRAVAGDHPGQAQRAARRQQEVPQPRSHAHSSRPGLSAARGPSLPASRPAVPVPLLSPPYRPPRPGRPDW